jgi:hypothetical protein
VDFCAPRAGLVVEVDGAQHLDSEGKARDAKRDIYLRAQGLQVLRFDNLQVLKELDAVMQVIYQTAEQILETAKSPLAPPFSKGGKNSAQGFRGTNNDPDVLPFSKGGKNSAQGLQGTGYNPDIPPFEKGGSGGI